MNWTQRIRHPIRKNKLVIFSGDNICLLNKESLTAVPLSSAWLSAKMAVLQGPHFATRRIQKPTTLWVVSSSKEMGLWNRCTLKNRIHPEMFVED